MRCFRLLVRCFHYCTAETPPRLVPYGPSFTGPYFLLRGSGRGRGRGIGGEKGAGRERERRGKGGGREREGGERGWGERERGRKGERGGGGQAGAPASNPTSSRPHSHTAGQESGQHRGNNLAQGTEDGKGPYSRLSCAWGRSQVRTQQPTRNSYSSQKVAPSHSAGNNDMSRDSACAAVRPTTSLKLVLAPVDMHSTWLAEIGSITNLRALSSCQDVDQH